MSINFPLLLVLAVLICGALALFDLLVLAPRRRAAIAAYQGQVNGAADDKVLEKLNKEPLLVEYGKSFFRCWPSCWCCAPSWSNPSRSPPGR